MNDPQNRNQGRHGLTSTERDRTHHLLGARFAVLAVVLTGCMLRPVDDETVASTSSVLPYWGYTLNPSELVRIEAFDGSAWTAIASTTSGATPERQYDGTDLYKWSVGAVVPSARWRRGTTGFVAQVHVLVGSKPNLAYTFTSDWLACLGSSSDLYDFISNCKSSRSPNAFLYTSDYPAGIDLTITNIRLAVGGGVDVSVRNGGRPGRITKIECHGNGGHIVRTINASINPVETQVIHTSLPVNAGQTVLCGTFGVNEDGSAEANTANNTRTQVVGF